MPTSFSTFNPGDPIENTHIEQYIQPVQNLEMGKPWYGEADGVSVNDLEVALDPAPSAYTAGMLVHFKSNFNITGPATLNVNGLGVKSLVKEGNTSLGGGDIIDGQVVSAIYDGSNFQLLSPSLLPVSSPPSVGRNLLVYSEVVQRVSSGTMVTVSLPNFSFDPLKKYQLEIEAAGNENQTLSGLRVSFSDGSSTYSYPGPSTLAQFRITEAPSILTKILPNLSGSHTVTITTRYLGHATIRLYEVHDNLVYADFTPPISTTSTPATLDLDSFVATSGHVYEMKVSAIAYSTTAASAACYLTDGIDLQGIPYSDPTVDFADGPSGQNWTMTKVLTGLSGTYQVKARGKSCNGVCVEIRDLS